MADEDKHPAGRTADFLFGTNSHERRRDNGCVFSAEVEVLSSLQGLFRVSWSSLQDSAHLSSEICPLCSSSAARVSCSGFDVLKNLSDQKTGSSLTSMLVHKEPGSWEAGFCPGPVFSDLSPQIFRDGSRNTVEVLVPQNGRSVRWSLQSHFTRTV